MHRGGGPRELSPHWKIPQEAEERAQRVIPRWMWITALASIALVLLLFLVFKLQLGSVASEAASRMVL
jgi:type VI protein secretion system component VasF